MERKSMGSFIAALRKANGLTQRELAEKLNVSDKAVSRWERDECAPDLSLIPVLAEIFDVTADELLCGERKKSGELTAADGKPSARSEKQTKHLLTSATTKFKNLSMISLGISAAALVTAILFEYFFENHYLTFAVMIFLLLISTVCETVFLGNSLSSVTNEEIESVKIDEFKINIIDFSKRLYAVNFYLLYTFVALLFYLPFCTGCESNGFFEQLHYLSSNSMHSFFSFDVLWITALYAAFAYILFKAIWQFVISRLTKSGTYPQPEQKQKLNNFKKRFFTVFALVISLSVFVQGFMSENIGYLSDFPFVSGTVFSDFESYKEYAGTEKTGAESVSVAGLTVESVTSVTSCTEDGSSSYWEEEVLDENGNVIDTFEVKNGDIAVTIGNYDNLPITVYTLEDTAANEAIYRIVCVSIISGEFIILTIFYKALSSRKKKVLNLKKQ